jgi:hypothetical protein
VVWFIDDFWERCPIEKMGRTGIIIIVVGAKMYCFGVRQSLSLVVFAFHLGLSPILYRSQ